MVGAAYRSLEEKSTGSPSAATPSEKYYPSIYLTADQFPELFAFGVSDGLELSFKCKIKSKSESEESKSMCVELRAAAVSGNVKDEYAEKMNAPAAVIVVNAASEALAGLLNSKPRRV